MGENENAEEQLDDLLYEDEKGEKVLVRSIEAIRPAYVRFTNKTNRPVDVWWRDYRGFKRFYTIINPRGFFNINTFITHPWEFTDSVTKENYVISNKIIFRPPDKIGGMEFRTNWNITSQLRSLRDMTLLKLGRTIRVPYVAYELGLPTVLAEELKHVIVVQHCRPQPVG